MLKVSRRAVSSLAEIGGQCAALYPEKPIYDVPAYPMIEAGALITRLEQQIAPFHRPGCSPAGERLTAGAGDFGLTTDRATQCAPER